MKPTYTSMNAFSSPAGHRITMHFATRDDMERMSEVLTDMVSEPKPTVVDSMPKRAAFIEYCKEQFINCTEDVDAWGKRKFKYPHVESMWAGWFNAPTAPSDTRASILGEAAEACGRIGAKADTDVLTALECVAAVRDLGAKPVQAKVALQEWLDKTAWAQGSYMQWSFQPFGMHLADVMHKEIDMLRERVAKIDELHAALEAAHTHMQLTGAYHGADTSPLFKQIVCALHKEK